MAHDPSPDELLAARIDQLWHLRPAPILLAVDGRSGTGKSTLAARVATLTGAAVIDGDDFYTGGSDAYWEARSAEEKIDLVIDWRRQRHVLETLADGRPASWHPYNWEADDGSLATHELTCPATEVIILEGAYAARPELADVLTHRVLLEAGEAVRRERLLRREGAQYRAEWEARWLEAETLYFGSVMPPAAFDLVLTSR